ncbi:uncharacterized protein [Bombus flavifrons]|uniref:uncharacterized protein n=1 Tax=Bombus flavifrons TaxID=103934 RepID=UPI00370456FE
MRKFYLMLGLLCIGANGEKKINLEDIERDNLKVEGISKSGITRTEQSKFLTKPEFSQQHYQVPNQYHGPPTSSSVTYVTPPPVQNVKQTLQMSQIMSNHYAAKEQVYQQQNNISPQQILPQRYYNEYQQQPPLPPKGITSNVYESEELTYQPEVNIGNQLQAAQQKTVSANFARNVNKEPVYIDIPTMHLLTYYPNLDVSSGKTGLLVPRLTTAATNHISIPLYTSTLNQKPIVAGKQTYQIQYAPKYNSVPAASSTKVTKGAVYTTPVNSKKFSSSALFSVPTYAPSDQAYAQGRQLLYTQAYIAPSQPQYVSQLVYTQPATVYMHATPVYSDVYARPPSYDQDNSLQGSVKYTAPLEELHSAASIADELPNQGLGQQNSQSVTQNYVKDPEEPNADLIPPQIPAQDFKSSATSLTPVSSHDEEPVPEQNYVGSSEPRSLLDSYVPSNVIAAQDSSKYQERPIKLERGFLPSKENFLYKKRKID